MRLLNRKRKNPTINPTSNPYRVGDWVTFANITTVVTTVQENWIWIRIPNGEVPILWSQATPVKEPAP